MAKRSTEDLAARMAASRPAEPAPAFVKPASVYTHRVTLDLTAAQHQALATRALLGGKGVTMAGILRALVDEHIVAGGGEA